MSSAVELAYENWNPVVSNANKKIELRYDRTHQPFRWRKPRLIFVSSMSDLFHEEVPADFIVMLIRMVIEKTPQHTYLFLTKRPDRMLEELRNIELPKNLWLGVSVEDQRTADKRIPLLLQMPAAVRFLSCEPLLSAVDLSPWLAPWNDCESCDVACEACPYAKSVFADEDFNEKTGGHLPRTVDWVIVSGESGRNARPMHSSWARSIRDQCQEAQVPFFFKQWGEWLPISQLGPDVEPDCKEGILYDQGEFFPDAKWLKRDRATDQERGEFEQVFRLGKKRAGRELDGREWNDMPERGDHRDTEA